MALMVHIPQELFESVLDELGDHPPSLRRCALVCHHFSVHSQKLLFKRIVLGRPSRVVMHHLIRISAPADKFYDHIRTFPHLRRLVRELVITDDRERKYYREDKSWIRQDRTIARILPLLEDLQGLEIEGNPKGNRLNFQAWRADLKSAILVKIPSLARLSLSHMRNIPPEMLRNIPKLRNLSLDFVLFANENIEAHDRISSSGVLEHFNIKSLSAREWESLSLDSLPGSNCPIDLTHITSLVVDVVTVLTMGHLDLITRLLNTCRNSLKNLEISFSDDVTSPRLYNDSYIDLASLPALQTLVIRGCLWSLRSCDQKLNAFSWLVTVLGKISPINMLRQIHLDLFLVAIDYTDISRSGLAKARWDDLIWVLLRLAQSSCVTLSVSFAPIPALYVVDTLKERLAPLTGLVKTMLYLEANSYSESSDSSESE